MAVAMKAMKPGWRLTNMISSRGLRAYSESSQSILNSSWNSNEYNPDPSHSESQDVPARRFDVVRRNINSSIKKQKKIVFRKVYRYPKTLAIYLQLKLPDPGHAKLKELYAKYLPSGHTESKDGEGVDSVPSGKPLTEPKFARLELFSNIPSNLRVVAEEKIAQVAAQYEPFSVYVEDPFATKYKSTGGQKAKGREHMRKLTFHVRSPNLNSLIQELSKTFTPINSSRRDSAGYFPSAPTEEDFKSRIIKQQFGDSGLFLHIGNVKAEDEARVLAEQKEQCIQLEVESVTLVNKGHGYDVTKWNGEKGKFNQSWEQQWVLGKRIEDGK